MRVMLGLEAVCRVGVFGLLLLGAVRAQNTTISDDDLIPYIMRANKAVWDQYKDAMPSCDESVYLSKAGAVASLRCIDGRLNQALNQTAGNSCLKECSDAISYYGTACKEEEVALEAKLAKTWQELLDSNKTLPDGGDGKILEKLLLMNPVIGAPEDYAPPGFTESGGGEFLADQNNVEVVKGLYTLLSQEFMIDNFGAYVDECMAYKDAAEAQNTTISNDLKVFMGYQKAVWDQYKDAMPSCNESVYLSKAGAEAELACLQAMNSVPTNESDTTMCYDECSDATSLLGIECQREEAAVGSQLGVRWQELLDSNKTLPTGGDGKILEALVASPEEGSPAPGLTESGGSEFLADPKNVALIESLYSNLAMGTDQFNAYERQCISGKSDYYVSGAVPKLTGILVSALMLLFCMI
jgi:hypothetical protein